MSVTLVFALSQALYAEDMSPSTKNVAVQDSSSLLWGVMTGSKIWQNEEERIKDLGVYRFYTDKSIILKQVKSGNDFYLDAGGYANGRYYTITSETDSSRSKYIVYDTNTWKILNDTAALADDKYGAKSLAFDPTDNQYYGMFLNEWTYSPTEFSTFEPATGIPTLIHSSYNNESLTFNALAINRYGKVYAIDLRGDLYSINKATGKSSRIGFTGVTTRYGNCMTFDYRNGKLYWYATNRAGIIALYEIDTNTATATALASNLNTQMGGLYIENPVYNTPDWVKNICYEADGKRTEGTLSFTMPNKTVDGIAISDNMDVRIVIEDGDTLYYRNIQPNQTFSTNIKLPENGCAHIAVTAKNKNGFGLTARVKTWTGTDIPVMENSAILSNEDHQVNLTWKKPTVGKNQGFIDDNNITYNITRNDGKVIAENIKDCNIYNLDCSDSKYSYVFFYIVASNTAGASSAIKSNAILTGKYQEIPFHESFTNGTADGNWFEENTTNQATCWKIANKGVNPDVAANDSDNGLLTFGSYSSDVPKGTISRIISPAIDLSSTSEAYLHFSIYHYAGTFITYDAVTPEIVSDNGDIHPLGEPILRTSDTKGWKDYSYNLSNYLGRGAICISFKGISDYGYNIHLDNIQITNSPASSITNIKETDYHVTGDIGEMHIISAENQVKVINFNGILVATIAPNTTKTIQLHPGYYLVTANGITNKILVK